MQLQARVARRRPDERRLTRLDEAALEQGARAVEAATRAALREPSRV